MSEQERANQVAEQIDRLMTGELVSVDDPLLQTARELLSFQPSSQALARFEQRLEQWFGPSVPPVPRLTIQPLAIAVALILAVLLTLALFLIARQDILPTSTPIASAQATAALTFTMTQIPQSPSVIATGIGSPSQETDVPLTVATESVPSAIEPGIAATSVGTSSGLPTGAHSTAQTPTSVPYVRVIIQGRIERIQGTIIVISGQTVQIEGTVSRLCSGDFIRVEVAVQPDGTMHAGATAITVETSACAGRPALPAPAGGTGDNGDDDD